MLTLSRRHFLKLSGALAGGITLSTAMQGCSALLRTENLSQASFQHGVASGDPGLDSLILWTRATPLQQEETLTLGWQIALDSNFQRLVRSGQVSCSAANDYTVKIDVQELQPGQQYFYRFLAKEENSLTGQGKTLPGGPIDKLKLAIFSCSNYPAGYFNVYQHAADCSDIDYALHLGDFIYEYSSTGYATENAKRIGRTLAADNSGELLTLEDYRKRYALYRTDNGLQAISAAVPMIAIWDDHEVANDTWKGGAENHNRGEGDFAARKLAAIQAYYEWMPIRPPLGEQSQRIYRSFDFGNLVSLHMLDTRVIARSKQLDLNDFVNKQSGQFDKKAYSAALSDPQRAMLGEEQMRWLNAQLSRSEANWQLLGQQVLMGRMSFPASIVTTKDRSKVPQIIAHLTALKQKELQGQKLSTAEQAQLAQKLPYNLDAWDGYPVEREVLYQTLQSKNGNVIVVAGDTHNAWHSTLTDHTGNTVGTEFATSSVSSPGMEHYLSLSKDKAAQLSKALPLLVDDLKYCNLADRGHLQLTFTAEQVIADWLYVDSIETPEFKPLNQHQFVLARNS